MNTRSQPFRIIGRKTPKVDAIDKVTGRAQFGADVPLPRLLIGKVLRSPYAHARIRRIDTSKAAALPGVHAIITGNDLPTVTPGTPGRSGSATIQESYLSQEVLAKDRVLFHGHVVAAVAATSSDIAEAALELIRVEYEPLPYVLDAVEAMQPGAVRLHDDLATQTATGRATTPSNVAEHLEMGRGDVQRGFAEADVVVERSFRTQTVHQSYIEPDSETAWVREDGSVIVWANTQTTFTQRHELAMLLDLPMHKVRVIPTEVGGAFGGKETIRVSALCVALSRQAGLPVRLTLSREEVLRATGPGSATVSTIKVGARHDGTITAIQARLVYDAGAFPGAPLRSAIRRVFSHYRTPNLKIDAFDVVTNKPHVAAYRAPGGTPTNFALESVIDEVGETLRIDPLAFRLQNVSRPGDPMPDGVTLPSVSLGELLQRVQRHPCWTTSLTAPNQGRGLALGLWTHPGGTTSCHLTLNADGSVTLVLGTVDLSATRTSLSMVAAEALGLDLEDVQVVVGDTDTVAYSGASAGDKVTYVTSKAILQASHDLLEQLKARVAAALEASPQDIIYECKRFWVQGSPERGMTLAEIAQRTIRSGGAVMSFASASETFSSVALAPNAAAHVVDVEVDRDTGQVKILRYTTFQDVGLCVNPDQVEGQMQGGATQGIGWALSETYLVDEKGAVRNANLLDYRLPSPLDVPYIAANVVEVPSSDHPYGIRAVGQVPIVPPAAALANAIYRATGVRLRELPMTAERLYLAMKSGNRSS
ncbi:MAG TPA: xanthine dehydrogenase family protein molybdopterin-binding subunit [Candidatus Tectomicrobia bacterium]|nr:xanthine dehydrogenase family protein molybdopterin-binding subunit [Candidatus Tectomicrobia bacterium]